MRREGRREYNKWQRRAKEGDARCVTPRASGATASIIVIILTWGLRLHLRALMNESK